MVLAARGGREGLRIEGNQIFLCQFLNDFLILLIFLVFIVTISFLSSSFPCHVLSSLALLIVNWSYTAHRKLKGTEDALRHHS